MISFPRIARHTALVLLALAACLLCACNRAPEGPPTLREVTKRTRPAPTKILLVGIDGATFTVIDPLIAEGRLPTLAGLIKSGARAPLRTELPAFSAAVWNTIATGRRRQAHRITAFRAVDPETGEKLDRLVSSNDRETAALWNIVGPFGKSAGVIAWWASWPAEPVNGWIISDHTARGRWTEWLHADRRSGLTFPADLAAEVAPLIVDPAAPPMNELAGLADFSSEELAEIELSTAPLFAHGPSVLKFGYCAQRSYERMAQHMLAQGQPDLTMVYLVAVDPASHTYWHYYQPQSYPPGSVDPEDAGRLGQLIPNLYAHNDAFIHDLLTDVDPDTVVLVVSDHGFQADTTLPVERPGAAVIDNFDARMAEALAHGKVTVGQPGAHHPDGIFIASGGPIRRGVVTHASVLDVAPTILALMGLPVADDMPGRVLEEIVAPEYWQEHPIQHIDSYERLLPREKMPVTGEVGDEQALQMLRALGYIK